MKSLLLVLYTLSTISFAATIPEHLENPAFDATKQPKPNEPAIDDARTKIEWDLAQNAKFPFSCKTADLWEIKPPSKINVTAMKNMTAPVKGAFERAIGTFALDKKTKILRGMGRIDLSSYNSGTVDRDRRIQRLIFEVEKKGKAVASFSYKSDKEVNFSDKGEAEANLEVSMTMSGNTYTLVVPVKLVKKDAKTLLMTSTKDARFTYVTDTMRGRLMKLLSECNHQFLSTFVDISFDGTLESPCGK